MEGDDSDLLESMQQQINGLRGMIQSLFKQGQDGVRQLPSGAPDSFAAIAAAQDEIQILNLRHEIDDIKATLSQFRSSVQQRHSPHPFIFPARSTSDGPTCWQEQTTQEDGTLGDYTDGRQSTTDGDDSNYIDGAELFLCEFPNIDKYLYALISAGFRIVSLTTDGGSDGTPTTANTYTYTGTAIGSGTSIFTAQASALQRANGHRVPATRGIWNSKNSELYPLDEIEGTDACPGGG